MTDLSAAAIDLLFEADQYAIDGVEITFANKGEAADELVEAGLAVKSVELCRDPCGWYVDIIRLTPAGVAEMSHHTD